MITIWWTIVALMAGGVAGFLVFALMAIASEQDGPPPLPTEFPSSDCRALLAPARPRIGPRGERFTARANR